MTVFVGFSDTRVRYVTRITQSLRTCNDLQDEAVAPSLARPAKAVGLELVEPNGKVAVLSVRHDVAGQPLRIERRIIRTRHGPSDHFEHRCVVVRERLSRLWIGP